MKKRIISAAVSGMLLFAVLLSVCGCSQSSYAQGDSFESTITSETLKAYADTNSGEAAAFDRENAKVLIDFHDASSVSLTGHYALKDFCTANGIVYIYPYTGAWCWTNTTSVRLTDRVLEVVCAQLGISTDTMSVVTTGRDEMGGQSALVYPVYSEYAEKIDGAAAINPACDMEKYSAYDGYVMRTLIHALGDYDMPFDDAVSAVSPVLLAQRLSVGKILVCYCEGFAVAPSDILTEGFAEAMNGGSTDFTYKTYTAAEAADAEIVMSDCINDFILSCY